MISKLGVLLNFILLTAHREAKGSSCCEQIDVEGSKSFPELMGTYVRYPESKCKSDQSRRPLYQLIKPGLRGFIFHRKGTWYMGTNSTSWETTCAIAVRDEALSPDKVAHVWLEMGPFSGHWNPDPLIHVSCAPVPIADSTLSASLSRRSQDDLRGGRRGASLAFDRQPISIIAASLEAKGGLVPPSAVRTEIGNIRDRGMEGCAGVWIRGSVLHEELMGVYRRTERLEDGRPTFRRRARRSLKHMDRDALRNNQTVHAGTDLLELAYYDQAPRGFWGIARGDDEYLPLHKLDSSGTLAGLTASPKGDGNAIEENGETASAWLEYAIEQRLLLPNVDIATTCVSWAELHSVETFTRHTNLPLPAIDYSRESIQSRPSSCTEGSALGNGDASPDAVDQCQNSFDQISTTIEPQFDGEDDSEMCQMFVDKYADRYAGYESFDEFLETYAPSLFNSGSMEELVAFSEAMDELPEPVVKLVMLGFDTVLWRHALNISRQELVAGYQFTESQIEDLWEMTWGLGIRQEHDVELLEVALEPLPVLQESWAPVLALIALEQLAYHDLATNLLLLDLNDMDIRHCVIRMLRRLGKSAVAQIRAFALDQRRIDPSLAELVEEIGLEEARNPVVFELCVDSLLAILMTAEKTDIPSILSHLLKLHGVDSASTEGVLFKAESIDEDLISKCHPPSQSISRTTFARIRRVVGFSRPLSAALAALYRGGCLRTDDGLSNAVSLAVAATVLLTLGGCTFALGRSRTSKRRKRHHAQKIAAAAASKCNGGPCGSASNEAEHEATPFSVFSWFTPTLRTFGLQSLSFTKEPEEEGSIEEKKAGADKPTKNSSKKEKRIKGEAKKEQRRQEGLEKKRKRDERRRIEKQKRKEHARRREEERKKHIEHLEAEKKRQIEMMREAEAEELKRDLEEETKREEMWRARKEEQKRKWEERQEARKRKDSQCEKEKKHPEKHRRRRHQRKIKQVSAAASLGRCRTEAKSGKTTQFISSSNSFQASVARQGSQSIPSRYQRRQRPKQSALSPLEARKQKILHSGKAFPRTSEDQKYMDSLKVRNDESTSASPESVVNPGDVFGDACRRRHRNEEVVFEKIRKARDSREKNVEEWKNVSGFMSKPRSSSDKNFNSSSPKYLPKNDEIEMNGSQGMSHSQQTSAKFPFQRHQAGTPRVTSLWDSIPTQPLKLSSLQSVGRPLDKRSGSHLNSSRHLSHSALSTSPALLEKSKGLHPPSTTSKFDPALGSRSYHRSPKSNTHSILPLLEKAKPIVDSGASLPWGTTPRLPVGYGTSITSPLRRHPGPSPTTTKKTELFETGSAKGYLANMFISPEEKEKAKRFADQWQRRAEQRRSPMPPSMTGTRTLPITQLLSMRVPLRNFNRCDLTQEPEDMPASSLSQPHSKDV